MRATGGGRRSGLLADLLRPVTARGWRGLARKIRELGILGTVRSVWRVIRNAIGMQLARRYDRRHGVDTGGLVNADAYQQDLDGNHGYLGIPVTSLRTILGNLGIDHAQYSFVDYGCGKGRAMLVAAERPFARVVGIEFADELVSVARANIANYRNGPLRCRDIAVVHADARTVPPPDGPCVLYFYLPFEPEIFDAVLTTIEQSHAAAPRPMLLVYCEDRDGDDVIPADRIAASGLWRPQPSPRLPFDWAAPRQVVCGIWRAAGG